MKKIPLLVLLLFTLSPINILAAGSAQVIESYDPNGILSDAIYRPVGSDFNGTPRDSDAMRIEIKEEYQRIIKQWNTTAYDQNGKLLWNRKRPLPNGLLSSDLPCNGVHINEFYDGTGTLLASNKVSISGLVKPHESCTNTNDNNDGGSNGGATCDICAALKEIRASLNANNSKLDSIIGKIPPPPNYQDVANKMRDTIVPKLVGDTKIMLDDLLGRAPAAPPIPAQTTPPKDLKKPDTSKMPADPNVKLPPKGNDNNFNANDVKDAPQIKYEEPDDDDGFKLNTDPMENLENPGSPGKPKEPEDPGSPGIPKEPEIEPTKPEMPEYNPGSPGTPNQDDIGTPGTPNQDIGTPGKPNDDIGSPSNPSMPDDDVGSPSKPSDDGWNPPGHYNPK